jgi:hypothetical protein
VPKTYQKADHQGSWIEKNQKISYFFIGTLDAASQQEN